MRFFNSACLRSSSCCSLRLGLNRSSKGNHCFLSLAASAAPGSVYFSGLSATRLYHTARLSQRQSFKFLFDWHCIFAKNAPHLGATNTGTLLRFACAPPKAHGSFPFGNQVSSVLWRTFCLTENAQHALPPLPSSSAGIRSRCNHAHVELRIHVS